MHNYIGGVKRSSAVPRDSYLLNLPVVRHLSGIDWLSFKKPVTFLVGENGTGKSTLLEAIAVCYGFNPEGGSRNFSFKQTEHYQLMRRFLENPNRMLHYLLDEA